jgi:peptidoglycan-N-acetylglucosamine deacetylase
MERAEVHRRLGGQQRAQPITPAMKCLAKWLLRPVLRYRGPSGVVYLTFDDGPNPEWTPRVLHALDHYGVKATFFMVGEKMALFPSIVGQVKERGHAVALHGFTHRHCSDMSWREQLLDLHLMTDVAEHFDVPMRGYRPAYGELSLPRVLWCVWRRVLIIKWSFESLDSFFTLASELEERVIPQALRDGDILLFHDDLAITAQALPTLLARAQGAGLRFGTLWQPDETHEQ